MRNGMSHKEAGKIGYLTSNLKVINDLKRKEIIDKYNAAPKLCKKCSSIIPYEKRVNNFCSSSCSASFNNIGVRRRGEEAGKCLVCGNNKSRSKSLYCSNACQKKDNWRIRKDLISSKGSVNLNTIHNSTPAKRYLKEVRGIKCEACGITEWMGKEVPLVLDHIDGNSDNWNLNNLRLICGNCDMQTSTYKGKNIGKGRHFRRLRYQQGKSY